MRRRLIGFAVMCGAAILAEAANAETVCTTIGNVTRCDSPQKPAIDYGAVLKRGQDLVPKYEPRSQTPPQTAAAPNSADMFLTGNGLLDTCRDNEHWPLTVCLAFIHGTASAVQGALYLAKAPARFCAPAGVTMGQDRDVVVRWLEKNPAQRHGDAAPLVIAALQDAFPCQK